MIVTPEVADNSFGHFWTTDVNPVISRLGTILKLDLLARLNLKS